MALPILIRQAAAQSARVRFYSTTQTTKNVAATASQRIKEQAKEKAAPKVGKLKELAQKYGAASVLVYLGIGVVDLGIAFGGIQVLGQSKVKQVEDEIVGTVNKWLRREPKAKEAQDNNGDSEQPSLTSVFLLAYAIHKTLFLPLRVTATAAVTPAFVRKIHQLGWNKYAPRLFGGVPHSP
ncbi:hypothetical protein BX666DRAFT_63400 [Dichotomocladium elegans]|nr:hypothetical protein BX666DRAFT_63400 [Dichotomocladium elegans]